MSTEVTINQINGTAVATGAGANKAAILGPAHGGTAVRETRTYTVSNISDLATYGFGPASEAAALFLQLAGGSVDIIFASASIAGVVTSVSGHSGLTLAGTPYANYDSRIRITTAGNTGSLMFQFTNDGSTYSDHLRLGNGTSSYVVPNTGLTWSFAAGTYTTSDSAQYDVIGQSMNATNLASCINTLSNSNTNYTCIMVANEHPSAVSASALIGALDGHLTTLRGQDKPTMFVADAGGETFLFNRSYSSGVGAQGYSSVVTQMTNVASTVGNHMAICAERVNTYLANSQVGYAKPRKPFAYAVGAEIHAVGGDISKNILESPIRNVETPSYDERQNGEVYLPVKVIAPRSRRGVEGLFVNNAVLKYNAATASSYNIIPRARVANKAEEVARTAVLGLIGQRLEVKTDGSGFISSDDKVYIEAMVNKALRSALKEPINGAGKQGHCSDVQFSIVETDLISSPILYGKITIVPLVYVERIIINLSFDNILI